MLCCRFVDLDEVISERDGRSIPEIFAAEGEAVFRRMEAEALRGIVKGDGSGPGEGGSGASEDDSVAGRTDKGCSGAGEPGEDRSRTGEPGDLVLALGGGTVMTPECAAMVSEHTFCIYLKASVETLLSHLVSEAGGRPLLKSSDKGTADIEALRSRITGLMELRSATYEAVSHLILDTDGKNISEIAALCIKMSK